MRLRVATLITIAGAMAWPATALGQTTPRGYAVSSDHAIVVAKHALAKHGFSVIRIEKDGPTTVLFYRPTHETRAEGYGPPRRLVIRRVGSYLVFERTPPDVLIEIDLRLNFP